MIASNRRCMVIPLLASCLMFVTESSLLRAKDFEYVPPSVFGLKIPSGPGTDGNGHRVIAADAHGNSVVALLWFRFPQHAIVMLPDGQLVVRASAEIELTERPFEAESKDDLATRLLSDEFVGFRTRQTRRFLYLYSCSDGFAELTSRILETMFQGVFTYAEVQGIEVSQPQTPLVVLLFRTKAEFQRYCRLDDGVMAFYDVKTNRIAIYEETDFWKIKPELAIQQSLATIAHEGAHQILHNIGVQKRLSVWPMWINEGLAEFFAPTSLDRHLKWKGAGQVNDLRMFELEQYIKSTSEDDIDGQLVSQTVGAARLTSTGYAAAWALTHYLAKSQRQNFHAYVREASQLGPLEIAGKPLPPGVIPGNVRSFKQHFGDDLSDLERRLILHLKQLPYRDPFLEWPHFATLVSVPNGRRARREAQVFHTLEQAEAWRQERLSKIVEPARNHATSTIRQFSNRILAEQFARGWLDGG